MKSRSDAEMMELILDVAKNDSRIRVVLQDGSRSNPNVAKDIFQDYDIIYAVKSISPFLKDHSWVDKFGERMLLQMPEDMELYPPAPELRGAFSYLMQFKDGNRIDLVLVPVKKLHQFTNDSLCKVLLDKDGLFETNPLPVASDRSYVIQKPSERSFGDCCNEFWFTNTGLAKGLWRAEIPLVKGLYHQVIHVALMQMIDWYIGCRNDFTVNPGKFGKFYRQYLEPEVYQKLLATWPDADLTNIWHSVYASMDLFRTTALYIASELGYQYPMDTDNNVTAYMQHVQQLPKNAERIY